MDVTVVLCPSGNVVDSTVVVVYKRFGNVILMFIPKLVNGGSVGLLTPEAITVAE